MIKRKQVKFEMTDTMKNHKFFKLQGISQSSSSNENEILNEQSAKEVKSFDNFSSNSLSYLSLCPKSASFTNLFKCIHDDTSCPLSKSSSSFTTQKKPVLKCLSYLAISLLRKYLAGRPIFPYDYVF